MALRRHQRQKNTNDAQAEWGRRTMTGSGNRRDEACGRLYALVSVGLAVLLGGCTADMSGAGSPLESALYSEPPAMTGGMVAVADNIEPAAAASAPDGTARIAFVTHSLTPAPAGRAEELARAMTEMLSARGYRLVTPPRSPAPDERLFFVAANFTIEPDVGGRGEKVGIDWLVSDALGDPVGKISQARRLAAHPTPEQWRTETLLAAAAATEGIARLVPVRP
jgi:hypothetical protein